MAQEIYTQGYWSLFNWMPTCIKHDLNVNNVMGKDYTGHVTSLYYVVLMNKQYKYFKRILVRLFFIILDFEMLMKVYSEYCEIVVAW